MACNAPFMWLIQHSTESGGIMRNSRFISFIFAALYVAGSLSSSAVTLIDVAFTSAPVTGKTGFAATGLTTNDVWNTYSPGAGPISNLQYADGTPSGANLTASNALEAYSNGASDPMYGIYLFPDFFPANIVISVSNLVQGQYNIYLYGHGDEPNQNSVFDVTVGPEDYGTQATINGYGWENPAWQEGVQYVEFTNVSVLPGESMTITVMPGASDIEAISGVQMAWAGPPTNGFPVIFTQPMNQMVIDGATVAVFSVLWRWRRERRRSDINGSLKISISPQRQTAVTAWQTSNPLMPATIPSL